jgi:4-nitrophenyl phosphatase
MDGVLWRDTKPIGNLKTVFNQIDKMGLKVILVTNNATKTIDEYIAKLSQFGVYLKKNQIITSAEATGMYIKNKIKKEGNVYVIGTPSLRKTLEKYGFNHTEFTTQKNICAVVVGLDFEFSYQKIATANKLIRSGVPFIGTNPDVTYPTPDGLIPGAGTMIKAVETASNQTPTIIGKPNKLLYEMAFEKLQLPTEDVLVVGDRIETDIEAAKRMGCPSALVLSGVTTRNAAKLSKVQPDIISKNLSSLLK